MENKETVKWVHPYTNEEEIVEKDSPRDKELNQKLHDIGLWANDDPDKPEGCIPFEEYIQSEQYKIDKEMYLNRFREKLNEDNETV